MKIIKLFFIVLLASCSTISPENGNGTKTNEKIAIPTFMRDTVTPTGIKIAYIYNTDTTAVLCAVYNNDTAYTNYTSWLKRADELPFCSFYTLQWSSEGIAILTRGCNSPPDVESIVFIFDDEGSRVNYYGYIRDYDDENRYIVHSKDYSTDYLVIEEIFSQRVIDTLQFEPLLRDEDKIEISLTTEFIKKDGKYFTFSGDTISFNFFGRDTFLLLDKRKSGTDPQE